MTADLLVGTSVGALNAAFIASRPQTPETARELAKAWCGIERAEANFEHSSRLAAEPHAASRDALARAAVVQSTRARVAA